MENLAYLYVLAEEAEHQATNDADPVKLNATQQQEQLRLPLPLQTQAVHGQHWLDDDCDRANQSYPTFYL